MNSEKPSVEDNDISIPARSLQVEQPTKFKPSEAAIERLMALGGRSPERGTPTEQRAQAQRLLARQQYAAKRDGKCPAIVKERNTNWPHNSSQDIV